MCNLDCLNFLNNLSRFLIATVISPPNYFWELSFILLPSKGTALSVTTIIFSKKSFQTSVALLKF